MEHKKIDEANKKLTELRSLKIIDKDLSKLKGGSLYFEAIFEDSVPREKVISMPTDLNDVIKDAIKMQINNLEQEIEML